MAKKIRRVVTGHDARGKAVVLFDGEAANARVRSGTGNVSTLLWVTDTAPAELSGRDNAEREIGTPPPLTGSIFRILEIPPESSRSAADHAATVEQIRREQAAGGQPGIQRNPDHRHHGMHRTESIDYALVLDGEIVMLLDESETQLTAGDAVVMQGTYHAWANRSAKPCVIAFILIGARVPWT